MSIAKPPFILGGMPQESNKTVKKALGQNPDKSAFMAMVGQNSELEPQEQQTPQIISRLFANGLAMGESQHQQNETIMQSVLRSKESKQGISLEKNSAGINIQSTGKGIPIDSQRDMIFSARNVSLSKKVQEGRQLTVGERVGHIAAQFESGSNGIAAIGYDKVGGTSYGKYQIASKPGSMQQFIAFLEKEEPSMAKRLKEAGPADTGSRGGKMPEVWQDIAKSEPKRFEELQELFISESHYNPAMNGLKNAGFNVEQFSSAMKEVVWSTSVQHGPSGAVNVFVQAADNAGIPVNSSFDMKKEQSLIENVYSVRASRFGSSTDAVQQAVSNRMNSERDMIVAMLQQQENLIM